MCDLKSAFSGKGLSDEQMNVTKQQTTLLNTLIGKKNTNVSKFIGSNKVKGNMTKENDDDISSENDSDSESEEVSNKRSVKDITSEISMLSKKIKNIKASQKAVSTIPDIPVSNGLHNNNMGGLGHNNLGYHNGLHNSDRLNSSSEFKPVKYYEPVTENGHIHFVDRIFSNFKPSNNRELFTFVTFILLGMVALIIADKMFTFK